MEPILTPDFRARYYDPAIDRFMSEDPIGLAGGVNEYAYSDDDPFDFSDPYGLDAGPINLGQGWSGRVDAFNGGQGFEIHVFSPAGEEVGVASGAFGWIGKHGFPDNVRPEGIPDSVVNAINGVNVAQLRARGTLPDAFRSGRYLDPGRALSVLNVADILLNEYIQQKDLETAGRKDHISPYDEFCNRSLAAGNPKYYMTSIGPMPNPCVGGGGII